MSQDLKAEATLPKKGYSPPDVSLEGNEVVLRFSSHAARMLTRLLKETGDTPAALFSKALGLYIMAAEAKREHKGIGIITSDNEVDALITDV